MSCLRCHGLLLREPIARRPAWWWRCVNCGARVDGTILLNRAEQAVAMQQQREAQAYALKDWADWLARIPAC